MRLLLFFLCLATSALSFGQTAPDFTIMDTQGNSHTLYSDYLDQGKVVVLKFFFSTCPPCNASAPTVQQLYEDYGAGTGDVQFMELTTQSWDNNSNVLNYVNQHGLTMPVSGADRGGFDASAPYRTGQFGSFFGTPSYAVIEPNGTVNYPVFFNNLVSTIDGLLGGGSGGPEPTAVNVSINNAKTGAPIDVEGLSVVLKPANSASPQIDLMALTNGTLSFDYPSASIPEMEDPVIVFSSTGDALSDDITDADVQALGQHILLLDPLTDPLALQAGDLNDNGTITGADVVALREVLLEKVGQFPSGTPAYIFMPSELSLSANPGGTLSPSVEVLKMGDVVTD